MNATEVRDLISNDLWQCTNPSNVSVKDFEALDEAVAKLTEAEDRQEFKVGCEISLEQAYKNSIAIKYMLTLTGRHPVDDKHIISILEQYYKISKWDEVIFLANKILSFNESTYALKVLAECYEANKMEEKKVEIWKRLVNVDFNETQVLNNLAEYYHAKGDNETALEYYKNLIRRLVKLQDLSTLKKVWDKVIGIEISNSESLVTLASKIANSMGADKGAYFLNDIYEKRKFDEDTSISLLKMIIKLSPNDSNARVRLIEHWKNKYKDNARLDYCLNNTGIINDYMNINLCIENFENQIQFVEGAFVFHEDRGLGRIKAILKDEMQVLFARGGVHKMSCRMAYSSLIVLPKTHIWVLKAMVDKDKLKNKFLEKNNVQWGLKVLLSSFDNKCTFKKMKDELVPAVLDAKDWTIWQKEAKKELSTNDYFDTSDDSSDTFILRSTPKTFEEKTLSSFKSSSDIYSKLKVMKDFIKQNGKGESDELSTMLSYFKSIANSDSDDALVSYLVLKKFDKKNAEEDSSINDETFIDYYNEIEDVPSFFKALADSDLKKAFIDEIIDNIENYQNILITLYPLYTTSYMADCIRKGPKKNVIYKILSDSANNCEQDPDFFLSLSKSFSSKDWAKAKCTADDLLRIKLNLLALVNKKISTSTDVTDNRKRQKILIENLFTEDKEVYSYLDNADSAQAQRLWSSLRGIIGIDKEILSVKHYISSKFEDWEAIVGEAVDKEISKKKIIPKGLLCTQAMLDAKSAELEHIMNVEIPENSKEIGIARDLGDLRENAEYQYAKDKQKNLNFLMNKLTDEVSSANVITPESVDTTLVSFGTKVTFMDNIANKEIVYTIFGPWESDPDKNILNFKAPLGQKLYNLEIGENTKFNINGVDYDFTVLKIELASF